MRSFRTERPYSSNAPGNRAPHRERADRSKCPDDKTAGRPAPAAAPDAQPLSDPLMAADVTAKAVAGEQRIAAERASPAPSKLSFPAAARVKAAVPSPLLEMGTLALTHAETEPRGKKQVVENQPGVGREHQVGQPGNRLDRSIAAPRSHRV